MPDPRLEPTIAVRLELTADPATELLTIRFPDPVTDRYYRLEFPLHFAPLIAEALRGAIADYPAHFPVIFLTKTADF